MRLAKKKRMGKRIKTVKRPVRSPEVPATTAMLYAMEDRLDHKIEGVRADLKSDIHGVKTEMQDMKSEMQSMKSEIQGIKSEIHGIKSEIQGMKSEMHGMKSEFHRVALLVEEQNARNKYVLDGYGQLYEMVAKQSATLAELATLLNK